MRLGLSELGEIAKIVRTAGYENDRIRVDSSVVRGLEYYTGPVTKLNCCSHTADRKGRPVRFGSVGGGGLYDGLVSRFRGEPVPATGFPLAFRDCRPRSTMLGKLDTTPEFGPSGGYRLRQRPHCRYQGMVATLRNANIRAELYLGTPRNMGNHTQICRQTHSPCVIIQGSDEKARGEVQIKDLIDGAKSRLCRDCL